MPCTRSRIQAGSPANLFCGSRPDPSRTSCSSALRIQAESNLDFLLICGTRIQPRMTPRAKDRRAGLYTPILQLMTSHRTARHTRTMFTTTDTSVQQTAQLPAYKLISPEPWASRAAAQRARVHAPKRTSLEHHIYVGHPE